MDKFKQLLKLGRALDEEAYEALMDSYEIIGSGDSGSYTYKGIGKEKFEELQASRSRLAKRHEQLKETFKEECV